jgi:hypothetical protein
MSVQELKQAVIRLSSEDLDEFTQWFSNYHQNEWDKQILEDSKTGRFNKLIQKAHQDIPLRQGSIGRYKTLHTMEHFAASDFWECYFRILCIMESDVF